MPESREYIGACEGCGALLTITIRIRLTMPTINLKTKLTVICPLCNQSGLALALTFHRPELTP